jgi:hypothetical protein
MSRVPLDQTREHRITMEIVVDAYGPEEQAMGWYAYLEDTLQFPFLARVTDRRTTSPLRIDEEVEVVAMAASEDCLHEMFVVMAWDDDELAVPLAQLQPVDADEETKQAVEDWRYWIERGYQL